MVDARGRGEEMLEEKGVAVEARNPGKVAVNDASAGTQRGNDWVGWPEEFPHGKEIWEDKNVRKIAGKI